MVHLLWKIVWHFLIKLNTLLLYNPAITLYLPRVENMSTQKSLHLCVSSFIHNDQNLEVNGFQR